MRKSQIITGGQTTVEEDKCELDNQWSGTAVKLIHETDEFNGLCEVTGICEAEDGRGTDNEETEASAARPQVTLVTLPSLQQKGFSFTNVLSRIFKRFFARSCFACMV